MQTSAQRFSARLLEGIDEASDLVIDRTDIDPAVLEKILDRYRHRIISHVGSKIYIGAERLLGEM